MNKSLSHCLSIAASCSVSLWAMSLQAQSITLEQAMADPDWIGRAPQQPYWADDSEAIYFEQKREGSRLSDLFRLSLGDDEPQLIEAADRAGIDVDTTAYSPNRRLKTYSRAGDIFVRNLRNGDITQLTRTADTESNP